MQDTSKIKERIISIIDSEGPNFPSPIASRIQTSILFTSAFLSELLSEKRLKITNMKVGSSPIYYLLGQEEKLEPFATKHLKSKEKDAFILLKEKQLIKDKEEEPAIRVALRSIPDFAIPEEKDGELYWKYFLNKKEIPKEEPTKEIKEENLEPIEKTQEKEEIKSEEKPLEIFDEEKAEEEKKEDTDKTESKPKKKVEKKKAPKKKAEPKVNEKFFNKVKDHLKENNIEISDIVSFSKTDVTLKVRTTDSEEYLLVAYNKKTIREEDIIKAFKIAENHNLKYEILSLGEPLKKVSAFIDALKKIKDIKKIN